MPVGYQSFQLDASWVPSDPLKFPSDPLKFPSDLLKFSSDLLKFSSDLLKFPPDPAELPPIPPGNIRQNRRYFSPGAFVDFHYRHVSTPLCVSLITRYTAPRGESALVGLPPHLRAADP